jgi:hypothetical protein
MCQSPERPNKQQQQQLYFESPRCEVSDEELLPNPTDSANLIQHDERWKHLAEQAGQHQQDQTTQHVNVRTMTPAALRSGMPLQAAARVRSLHLELDERDDRLPAWLDVITTIYFHLEHLYLGRANAGDEEDDIDTEEKSESEATVSDSFVSDGTAAATCTTLSPLSPPISNRMRRLYILYRLPDLLSIDGVTVTDQERLLARPDHPNGHRVKRDEWVENACLLDQIVLDEEGECLADDDYDDEYEERDAFAQPVTSSPHVSDSVEVDLSGTAKLVPAKQKSRVTIASAAQSSLQLQASGSMLSDNIMNPLSPATGTLLIEQRRHSGPHIPELAGAPIGMAEIMREFDNLEYDAVATDTGTTAACEWSAACGRLSLPYFRGDSARRLKLTDAVATTLATPKIRLSFGRRNKDSSNSIGNKETEAVDVAVAKQDAVETAQDEKTEEIQQLPSPDSPFDPILDVVDGTPSMPMNDTLFSPSSQEVEIDEAFQSRSAFGTSETLSAAIVKSQSVPPAPRHALMLQRTLDPSSHSPNKQLPPSKSLASPFPMQFRIRAKIGQSLSRDLSVTTKLNAEEDMSNDGPSAPPPPPRRQRSPSDFSRETIESPVELVRVQSSPSKLPQSARKSYIASNRGDLPPPCPGGRRTPTATPKRKEKKKKRGPAKWREKLSRSSSIIDDDEEEEEDSSSEFSSDEENVVTLDHSRQQ